MFEPNKKSILCLWPIAKLWLLIFVDGKDLGIWLFHPAQSFQISFKALVVFAVKQSFLAVKTEVIFMHIESVKGCGNGMYQFHAMSIISTIGNVFILKPQNIFENKLDRKNSFRTQKSFS